MNATAKLTLDGITFDEMRHLVAKRIEHISPRQVDKLEELARSVFGPDVYWDGKKFYAIESYEE
jgi:hypothetical protein